MNRRFATLTLAISLLLATGCGGDERAETPPAAVRAAPTATAAAPAATVVTQAAPGVTQTVEQATSINSYRMHIVTRSESPAGADVVEIDGAFVKEPPAEKLEARFQNGEQTFAMIAVDGVRYLQAGDQWLQTPDAKFSVNELTLITPEDVTSLVDRMERVGVEQVNGLDAIHYRGGKEMIPVAGAPGDTLDVSQLAFAQLDLWVDQATDVVTRLSLQANDDSEGPVALSVVFDFFDFNAAIEIMAPEVVSGAAIEEPSAAAPTSDALSDLLGFRLLMPTGSSVETVVGGVLVSVLSSYTVNEAQNMVEQTLPANGYTLVTKAEPDPGQVTYVFQQGGKVVSVTVSDAGNGAARIQFASAP